MENNKEQNSMPYQKQALTADLTKSIFDSSVPWIGKIILTFHIVTIPIEWGMAPTTCFLVLLSLHIFAIVIAPIFYLTNRKRKISSTGHTMLLALFCLVYVLSLRIALPDTGYLLEPQGAAGVTAILCLSLSIDALTARQFATVFAVAIITSVSLLLDAHNISSWLAIHLPALVVTGIVSRVVMSTRLKEKFTSYQSLLRVAPQEIARRSILENQPLDKIFPSAQKDCIIVSLSWRNYPNIAKSLSPAELVKNVEAYYRDFELAFRDIENSGTMFVDATGDEVFVVIIPKAGESVANSWETCLSAVSHFILARDEDKSVLPGARVGIGMTFGPAWVGVIGPKAHRKTTAVGETPGLAARLKTLALSQRFNDDDKDCAATFADNLSDIKHSKDWTPVFVESELPQDLSAGEFAIFRSHRNKPKGNVA